MTEIALHGLNVVAALDRGNGEGVTQIVEACGRCADVSDNAHSVGVCEHKEGPERNWFTLRLRNTTQVGLGVVLRSRGSTILGRLQLCRVACFVGAPDECTF